MENKTTEELQSELKMAKSVTGALIGVLTVLVAACIYGLLSKGNNTTFFALIAVAVSCSAIVPIQLTTIKKIKTELSTRKMS
ncbi:hypothetical protein KO500_00530 [Cellulophaga baltica]|uniref:hypothetical protein n=1 Tax=Cellulophaga TaxID=104264 RepID=UPI001C07094E|nr:MULTISPECIES: hypothetical protein [Cellulophaga]MBU2994897.1 hypothetical protein [Cellulophaga baltica]MDO6766291.1 hypothetical protein [Cellulophaga sp. 1_MG-2023]